MTPDTPSRGLPRIASVLSRVMGGGTLLGLGVAALTIRLEPELAGRTSDVLILLCWGAGFYGLAWLLTALLPCLLVHAIGRRRPEFGFAVSAVLAALVLAPSVYLLLLPQVGLTGDLLTHALFARGPRSALALVGSAGVVLALGFAATRLRRLAWWPAWLGWPAVFLATATGLVLSALAVDPPISTSRDVGDPSSTTAPEHGLGTIGRAPKPVLLLCIDGADPHVLRELMDAGQLPTFSKLAREGTWGELATLRPTLSPLIWTTLITGRTPEDHGIHQFVYFRLPGVQARILEFPQHSGLNFLLVRPLERGLGIRLRFPYTTGMRRVDALWNIVGRYHRVGVYRWLMTWPAEDVNGFFVSGGIAWARLGNDRKRRRDPPELPSKGSAAQANRPGGDGLERKARPRHLVTEALRDPAVAKLQELLSRYQPTLVSASFFPVDAGQHLFGHVRGAGSRDEDVVDDLYRLADERLGELMATVDPETRWLVVSDHGYDFGRRHHSNAPPGVFFASGEGIAKGREVYDLSVYDVAPLVLRLLEMPLAEDMPGTVAGRYRRVLDDSWASEHEELRIPSWEREGRTPQSEDLVEPEIDEVLRALGYVK